MRTTEIKEGQTIIFDGKTARETWSTEAAEDMKKFHNINIAHEIALAPTDELDREFNLSDEEKVHVNAELESI